MGEPLTAAASSLAASAEHPVAKSSPTTPATSSYTRFERARILGARALQVSLGAPILVEVAPSLIDPVAIAEREFAAGMIPITVRRGHAE